MCSLVVFSAAAQQAKPSIAQIEQQFFAPPEDTKPMVRWWWFGPAVEKPEILRELQHMRADNFGGVELAFVYPLAVDDPAQGIKNLPFLSPEMLSAVAFAQAEGRKLGMRVDLTLCSGWPYGGPAITLAQAAQRLRVVVLPLASTATAIPKIKLGEGESIISKSVANGTPNKWDAATAQHVDTALPLLSSAKARVALFFITGHTMQQVKRAAVQAAGYVLDPFSKQAVATHLKEVGEPLLSAFGATPPYSIFSDSLEAYGADWTSSLPEEFMKRRGYDLLPHLPELVAGGSSAADQVRHDYGRTLTELVDENYLSQINTWAHNHGTRFRSQTYGTPAVSLASQRLVDLPEGEGPQWREFSTLRWAASANHLFGNNVTSGESFTWLHSPVFRATPLDMKAEADIDLIMGENQFIYHGWPYSPPQAGEPGWSLYAAAVFNDHNPWHPVMPYINRYVQRLSFMLRQGEPANQIALLLPTDDAWAGFTPGHVSVSESMKKLVSPELISSILSAGYNLDFTDADTINRIGIRQAVLVLPPTDRIPLETLHTIAAWASAGGHVIAVERAPSISEDGKASPEFIALSKKLFTGASLVADPAALESALHRAATPDFRAENATAGANEDLGFIHRTLPDADIYFVANTSNRHVKATVKLASRFKQVTRWSAESGVIEAIVGQASNGSIDVDLAPYESALYVVRDARMLSQDKVEHTGTATSFTPIIDLTHDWEVNFSAIDKKFSQSSLTDWIADPATANYSGEAVYSREFKLASIPGGAVYLQIDGGSAFRDVSGSRHVRALGADGLPDPKKTFPGLGIRAAFDPPIREAALLSVNGHNAGALWHPPNRLEISSFLHPGTNHLEILVFNTALNAWSAKPPQDYGPLIKTYGDRFQMQDLDQVGPISSGLLGTILLVVPGGK